MIPIELLAAGLVLVLAVAAGTVAHELAHAVVLRAAGVPVEVEWLRYRGEDGALRAAIAGQWATVTPRSVPAGTSPGAFRLAAMAPLSMAAPLLLVPLGVLPDPFAVGDPLLVAAVVGWIACAVPSPQDFSLFWHARRAIEARGERVRS